MKIIELRILPPIAIGRLGESDVPMEAYDLELSKEKPLDYRKIIPQTTLSVDPVTGEIKAYNPENIKFKDVSSLENRKGKIHPVSPFLEVFAITDQKPDELVPVTEELLVQSGLSLQDISWNVDVANIKIFRRTGDENDKMSAVINNINSHELKPLLADCNNFLPDKKLPLGFVQFIKPTKEFPELRLRYTPAGGIVYGSRPIRKTGPNEGDTEPDPTFHDKEDRVLYDRIIYDPEKGKWCDKYKEGSNPNIFYTVPAQIFAGYSYTDELGETWQVSWGYIDDECDGFVTVKLNVSDKKTLTAKAHISAGPPAFAPDTLPIRVVSDELEQILLSTDIEGEVSIEEAEDIIRRAFETIRLMNTTIMNGNSYEGKQNVASTMVRQNTNDFGRFFEPIMATSLVDNLALQVLHERVFNGLSSGASPWFGDLLRKPTEIGDLSSKALRKMPALMRGADGRSLTFTYRQINMIIKAATTSMFRDLNPKTLPVSYGSPLKAANLTAQLHYRGTGNPISVLPRTAISNCFPGLEFDFRNLWRRAFNGITLMENNNYVLEATTANLKGHRLVAIEGRPTMVKTTGPLFPNGDSVPLKTDANPNGVSFMEWSNSMVQVLQKQGQEVICHFTAAPSPEEVVVDLNQLNNPEKYIPVTLVVNKIFDGNSAAFSDAILKPGELTQGLCAPWQNDYRECSCYYWAASRPDFVNIVPNENGLSTGDLWMSKKRTGSYIPDDWKNSRLLSYQDLFENWQGELNFIIEGKDALHSSTVKPKSTETK
ncbi:hypothetical protein [Chitinophaga sancti]|uniref:Uncharacterized protein n=1 Tax=Chitinophaga sancti TaxID=1004 RepID=A0A1K1RSB8_9BACT|nr:hypothetical protein [Chitinophaga sancti]WQD62450.1 hypothetical protein U0033_31655 [Chitinophaga sancti]WQG91981.1 hypothetical protein SR876_10730 [Chitinophaga sancti]SFW75040.1 hypothetical protein SAMN05661012_04182 [Chitinophaga sancti]